MHIYALYHLFISIDTHTSPVSYKNVNLFSLFEYLDDMSQISSGGRLFVNLAFVFCLFLAQ